VFDSEDGLTQEGEGVVLELENELAELGDGEGEDVDELGVERDMPRHQDEPERLNGEVWSYGAGMLQEAAEDAADITQSSEVKGIDGDVREQ